ncbi:hypothetical protein EDB87DRAFT_487840 [Lactarius vividus]|nr:hypothetical protein EDB87DRAFT_487840 [Lactarius vividus]
MAILNFHSHFHSNSDLTTHRIHPFHLTFNQGLLGGPSLHYPPAQAKPDPSLRSPPHHQSISWPPLPSLSGPAQHPHADINRPWVKPTPEVFLPASGADSQNYHSFLLLEPRETSANFPSDTEPYDPSALPTLANSMLAVDTRTDHPREPVVYFSGSESDSGHELDDEHNATRDASKDQPTSIPTASPQAKPLDVVLSRRSASFLAIEGGKSGPDFSSKDLECPSRTPRRTRSSSRKPKMHQCQTCKKWFPRPSGLATHMNVHSGAKPFTCPVQSCNKKFAVRSNAKRHLRTHGIMPTPDMSFISTPVEGDDAATAPDPAFWIPQSLKERHLKVEDLDTCPLLLSALPLVRPSTSMWHGELVYEERDSFADAPVAPYHPAYWRRLPGPAPTTVVTCVNHSS